MADYERKQGVTTAPYYVFPGSWHAPTAGQTLVQRKASPLVQIPIANPDDDVVQFQVSPPFRRDLKHNAPDTYAPVRKAALACLVLYMLYHTVHFGTQYYQIHNSILASRNTDEVAFEHHCRSAASMEIQLCKDIANRRTDAPRIAAMQDAMQHVFEHSLLGWLCNYIALILQPIYVLLPALSYVIVGVLLLVGAVFGLRWYFTTTVYVRKD